jgi:hypothetical protein
MRKFKPKDTRKKGPEGKIQEEIIIMLRAKEWFVKPTHGNMYQSGFPDLFACHARYVQRWIEFKNSKAYYFTNEQVEDFPRLCANGSGVWILVEASETEYDKLFKSPNWFMYLSIMDNRG